MRSDGTTRKDEEYSIKSGYRVAMSSSSVASPSSPAESSSWWKGLWKLSIPPKIKLFAWWVCKGWIPTKMVLERKKIVEDTRCPLCHWGPGYDFPCIVGMSMN